MTRIQCQGGSILGNVRRKGDRQNRPGGEKRLPPVGELFQVPKLWFWGKNKLIFFLFCTIARVLFYEFSTYFEYLMSKGFKLKVNVMDNQATKAIKTYLTPQQVTLQLVKPHNHRVNAAERAIQIFKNRFIGALQITDSEFPIQLWNKLAPQVQDCINLLCCSRISPTKLAHETLEGPYDHNRNPLAPLSTRAIIYEDSDTRASWALHGLGVWYLGPSKDHYQCHIYYVHETRGYRVSRSAEFFPQHC